MHWSVTVLALYQKKVVVFPQYSEFQLASPIRSYSTMRHPSSPSPIRSYPILRPPSLNSPSPVCQAMRQAKSRVLLPTAPPGFSSPCLQALHSSRGQDLIGDLGSHKDDGDQGFPPCPSPQADLLVGLDCFLLFVQFLANGGEVFTVFLSAPIQDPSTDLMGKIHIGPHPCLLCTHPLLPINGCRTEFLNLYPRDEVQHHGTTEPMLSTVRYCTAPMWIRAWLPFKFL